MPVSLNIRIADINFSVQCRQPVILDELPKIYQQFMGKAEDQNIDAGIAVTLALNNLPDIRTMRKIFDTDDAWSMYLDKEEYVMLLNPPVPERKIVWAARYGCDVRNISIHCSEMLIRRTEGTAHLINPFRYPMDQILVMYALAQREGALIHAAGLSMDNRGYIFPGRSGAGKSTLSRLFLGRDTAEMLSDDRIIIRKIDGKFKAFGTPWAGDAGIAENKSFPLYSIFFIHHAEKNMIREITPREAIEKLMPVTSIPWYDTEVMDKVLLFCEDLTSTIPAYNLYCKPGVEVVDAFEKFVSE